MGRDHNTEQAGCLHGKRARRGMLAAAAATAVVFSPHISDMALPYTPTSQEAMIADTLGSLYPEASVRVHCDSKQRIGFMALALSLDGELKGFAVYGSDTVWLNQNVCDDISAFASQPPAPSANGMLVSYEGMGDQIGGLRALAHEGAHAIENIMSEADAECAAAGTAGRLAVAMGMDTRLSGQFQEYVIRLQANEHPEMPPQYSFSEDCRAANALLNMD